MEPPFIINVSGLSKAYGSLQALQEVSFTLRRGGILAYLGPNGAGKTTTIRILSGLLDRDAGEVKICGLDVAVEPVAVKRLIGVVPDESNLYPELSCRRFPWWLHPLALLSPLTYTVELLRLGLTRDSYFPSPILPFMAMVVWLIISWLLTVALFRRRASQ
ncbi:MAG: ATP-binding cassette domain-containing protein [Deltaproteobacteria bacterium]|nr:ATP-binding cassette domain-containing protein [Deltaproteobacteria bacterium]